MINLSSLLKSFGLFILIFSALLAFSSLDLIEKRLGNWFINSSDRLFSWTMPDAAINVEHDRDPNRFDPDEVWISPVDKKVIEEIIAKSRLDGKIYEVENDASLLFRIGTFPKTSLVFLLALVLTTPMILRKKAKALLIALLAFMLYFYFFIYISVLHHTAVSRIGIYELDGTAFAIVNFLNSTFCNFGFSLSFALLVWMMTCIDFNAFLKQFNVALQGESSVPNAKKKKHEIAD